VNLHEKIYSFLEKRGFNTVVCNTILALWYVSALSLILGLLLLPWTSLLFWFAFGTILSNWNFFLLAFFVQKVINPTRLSSSGKGGIVFAQVILSNLRLFFTLILVYSALIVFNANPIAILTGLSISLVAMPIFVLKGTHPNTTKAEKGN